MSPGAVHAKQWHKYAPVLLRRKDVSLFVDAKGRHQLADPLTRETYLYLIEHCCSSRQSHWMTSRSAVVKRLPPARE